MAYSFASRERVGQDIGHSCMDKMLAKPDKNLHTEELCAGIASQNETLVHIIMIQMPVGIQA
jgi:hypothetical protein